MLIRILIFCCILLLANADICTKMLHVLAGAQGLFLNCVTTNSVPVTMCIGCKDKYTDVLHAYDELVHSCNGTYFDNDRLNVVPSTEAFLTGLWTKAYCDDCFNNNNSIIFNNKATKFNDCLSINYVKPCDNCNILYKELNDFYLSLDRHNDGEVCFDIQDSMNRTRNKWSKELQCCLRQYNILYFTIALAVTTFITLMFYCSTYLLTKRQERNHGILNDEDPLFNSPSSSIAGTAHLNIRNNQMPINRCTPITEDNNMTASTSQLHEEKNKITKAVEESEDSSDDELLIKNSSVVKEKLK